MYPWDISHSRRRTIDLPQRRSVNCSVEHGHLVSPISLTPVAALLTLQAVVLPLASGVASSSSLMKAGREMVTADRSYPVAKSLLV
ncbi:hypothetical protein K523DRAFT_321204 [Schizophyllum commune Tattone D]|nr:hypothetical protein K523DRAFT_321204 [Schizophyllum commune Tattone D]